MPVLEEAEEDFGMAETGESLFRGRSISSTKAPEQAQTVPGTQMDRRLLLAVLACLPSLPARAQTPSHLRDVLAGFQTTAMQVLRGGEPVFEHGDLTLVSYIASARKSLLSMLYGPAVATGAIRLDITLAQMDFDDKGGLLPRERTATVRDLLMARSGIYHKAANSGDASDRAPPRGSVAPGSYFLYNNWDFNALGVIYERQTGRKFYEAFGEDIAVPLGLKDWRIDTRAIRNDTGLSDHPAYHLLLSTRDMATIGQVMLRKGRWQDRQIIPADWVARTTALSTPAMEVSRTSPFIEGLGYGWLWWVFDPAANWPDPLRGAYTASGAFGQFITVIPSLDLVVAHKVQAPSDRNVSADDYLHKILPAALRAA
jgi:CubicO group peptidase (beta-lactamase class C family)